jgi:glycosyltransferase involved in cell wall biosynthesis
MSTVNGKAENYEAELLLVLPVCLAQGPEGLLFESQAARGIERWLESFPRIQVLCPLMSDADVERSHSIVWKPVSEIAGSERVKFIPLPYAMSLVAFMRVFINGRSVIRAAIKQSQYLCFAIGGLFGDWGAVACLEAHRSERSYAVWTDRVEHKVGLAVNLSQNPVTRLKENLRARMMYSLERFCIRHSTLGLFHGASCYSQYAAWCPTPYLVQDYPLPEIGVPADEQSETSCKSVKQSGQLTIAYVGRADEMKGPCDWLAVMEQLHRRGTSFHATWLGDGPMLGEMRAEVERRGLGEVVSLPGFVEGRERVFGLLHQADLLVFCHKTPESPRCLVEALISGCPIVGYESEYAAGLIENGGGSLVGIGDIEGLVELISALDSDRSRLAALKDGAVPAGKQVQRLADFRYRSDLIKAHL